MAGDLPVMHEFPTRIILRESGQTAKVEKSIRHSPGRGSTAASFEQTIAADSPQSFDELNRYHLALFREHSKRGEHLNFFLCAH